MILTNRIILDDNGTLTDVSAKLSSFSEGTGTVPVTSAQDAIYIGSELPFSSRYIEVSTANSNASDLSVALWDGSSFTSAVDVIDQTAVTGAAFAQDGTLSFKKDKDEVWKKEDTNDGVTDLSSLTIYDLYWAKITFSADLSADTAISYVGHRFASSEDLAGLYPELDVSSSKTQYESGKTDWNEQLVAATQVIIRRILSEGRAISGNQILDTALFMEACIHKAAAFIFNAYGDDYVNNMERAQKMYDEAFKVGTFRIDKDHDTRLDPSEMFRDIGVYRR